MIARKKNYFEVKELGAAAAAKGVRRWDKNNNRQIQTWKHIRLEETIIAAMGPSIRTPGKREHLTSWIWSKPEIQLPVEICKKILPKHETKLSKEKTSWSTIADDEATSTMEKEYFCIDIL